MRYLLHDVFSASVEKHPQNIAIYQEDFGSITYEELDSLSNKFGNYFKKFKDKRKNPFVGILSTVTINSIAAILGALKVGLTYVPLDELSPVSRLQFILQSTRLDTIVIDPIFYDKFKGLLEENTLKKVIFCEGCDFKEILNCSGKAPPLMNQVCDDLAYILHSSGSTGVPKGIMLTHRNARTFVDWMHKEFETTKDDVIMSRAPFKFDLSVFDIFNTFKAGAKLVCFNWNKGRSKEKRHKAYVSLMESQKATILYTTPSTFITLMNRGDLGEAKLHLRQIMYAGEPFPVAQLIKLKKCLKDVRIANIYGPSETNIITYYWIDKINENDETIPLGKEVDDTEIIVVSEDGKRICEPNEIGELWCRGGTVTIGYLGLPEQTKECLVESPFHAYPAKFWRTGDYGFRDENAVLYYRGRKDHMVKVKGYRIELGEIESTLAAIKELDIFCVIAVPDEKIGNRLHCFYSTLQGVLPEDVKQFLAAKLPKYMVPDKFIEKDVMPKTSAGKVDRIKLAEDLS